MKTYSRKNSSYLKKAFVASNFNEMCRLCLSEIDLVLIPIFQERQISYQELIQYSVDVSVEEGDGLPSSICEECLGMVEQGYLFKKKCQLNDSKLREHLRLTELNEESKVSLRLEDEKDVEAEVEKDSEVRKELPEDSRDNISAANHDKSTNKILKDFNLKEIEIEVEKEPELDDVDSEIANENVGPKRNGLNHQYEKPTERNAEKNLKVYSIPKVRRYEREKNKQKEKKEHVEEEEFDKTETELIRLLEDDDQPTSIIEKSQNDFKVPNSPKLVSSDLETVVQSADDPNNVTIIKVYTLVENDSDEELEDLTEPRKEIMVKPDKMEEIRELWDNDDDEINTTVKEVGAFELEQQEDQELLVLDVPWTKSNDNNTSGPFEVKIEENGEIKTREYYVCENANESKVFWKCSTCQINYDSKAGLKEHMATHKSDDDISTCPVCLKKFSCPNSLKRHMLVHTGTKPYVCEICDRRFSQSSILKRHKFTHNASKPFQCSFCKKSYTQKMNLKIHLRNHGIKEGQKESYKCNLCSKTFVHHSGLSRHVKFHKGVKAHCPHCNRPFTDASAMLRHARTVHKSDTSTLPQ